MGLFKESTNQLAQKAKRLRRLNLVLGSFAQGGTVPWQESLALPDGERVAASQAAAYYLIFWREWSALHSRWRAYYARPDGSQSRFAREEAELHSTAQALVGDRALHGLIAAGIDLQLPGDMGVAIGAEAFLDLVLWGDDLAGLTHSLSAGAADPAFPLLAQSDRVQSWLGGAYEQQSDSVKQIVDASLDRYRRFMLYFSFLDGEQNPSFLTHLLHTLPPPNMIEIQRNERPANGVISNNLNPLLGRLGRLLAEAGYGSLTDDLLDGAVASAISGDDINVIPGAHAGACRPLLLAFSKGSRGTLAYSKILASIRTHLIDCAPPTPSSGTATTVVAFFCDHWDASVFDSDFYDDFARFHSRGVEFVFLLVGAPRSRSVLSEINVNFK